MLKELYKRRFKALIERKLNEGLSIHEIQRDYVFVVGRAVADTFELNDGDTFLGVDAFRSRRVDEYQIELEPRRKSSSDIAYINGKKYEYNHNLKNWFEKKCNLEDAPLSLPVKAYFNSRTRQFVVEFNDGTTSYSTVAVGDDVDPYVGVALASAKRLFGSNAKYRKMVDNIYMQPKPVILKGKLVEVPEPEPEPEPVIKKEDKKKHGRTRKETN